MTALDQLFREQSDHEFRQLHDRHLRQCDQCNYEKDCFCSWADDPRGHDCNCPEGDGLGRQLIREEKRRQVAQRASASRLGGES